MRLLFIIYFLSLTCVNYWGMSGIWVEMDPSNRWTSLEYTQMEMLLILNVFLFCSKYISYFLVFNAGATGSYLSVSLVGYYVDYVSYMLCYLR